MRLAAQQPLLQHRVHQTDQTVPKELPDVTYQSRQIGLFAYQAIKGKSRAGPGQDASENLVVSRTIAKHNFAADHKTPAARGRNREHEPNALLLIGKLRRSFQLTTESFEFIGERGEIISKAQERSTCSPTVQVEVQITSHKPRGKTRPATLFVA